MTAISIKEELPMNLSLRYFLVSALHSRGFSQNFRNKIVLKTNSQIHENLLLLSHKYQFSA